MGVIRLVALNQGLNMGPSLRFSSKNVLKDARSGKVKVSGLLAVRRIMDPISLIDSLSSASKAQGASPAARVIASYGEEIAQLIAATSSDAATPTLGTKVDVKA